MSKLAPIRDAVMERLPQRHRAEQRFQAYGLTAITLAVLFLTLLVGSILTQSLAAFTAHRLTLPVTLERELVDPRGDGSEASLRRGSYNAALQAALRDQFPTVHGVGELRELFGIYSAVNASRLLTDVVNNPDLVGQSVDFEFPISDDADRYLKGASVSERQIDMNASLSIEIAGNVARLEAQEAVLAPFADRLRQVMADRANRYAAAAEAALASARQTIDPDEREILEAEAQRAQMRVQQLNERLRPGADFLLGPREPSLLVRAGDTIVRLTSITSGGREATGEVLLADQAWSGSVTRWSFWEIETPAATRLITDRQMVFVRLLEERGLVRNAFNALLFTNADSREPELAGVRGALIGTILTMVITIFLAVPVGVGAAIYLEEFAPRNRLTRLIEVNINNLAAVPSIVFGLLGLAVFINAFGLPRSTPLLGGMVLALMTLPTVIISSRAALKAVPPSIREAALGVGASRTQAVFHHVLPLAMPGMLTGSIIGLAQALGETAPLLMIGMVAFVADAPNFGFTGFTDPSTVMPVQIFIWSTSAERAFEARTAAAILVLLVLMVLFNAVAIYLRRKYERRW